MTMVSVVYADALIACSNVKYHYAFWRPVTAIRAGNTDDNARTLPDPAWSPLLPATPNHPEYPSAHSCITPSGGRVIARFLQPPWIDFTIPSLTGLGDRHYATVKELQDEVGNARIWGGSTTAQRSRTASPSASRSPTTCSPTTSTAPGMSRRRLRSSPCDSSRRGSKTSRFPSSPVSPCQPAGRAGRGSHLCDRRTVLVSASTHRSAPDRKTVLAESVASRRRRARPAAGDRRMEGRRRRRHQRSHHRRRRVVLPV